MGHIQVMSCMYMYNDMIIYGLPWIARSIQSCLVDTFRVLIAIFIGSLACDP
jgi:hypothetical protein